MIEIEAAGHLRELYQGKNVVVVTQVPLPPCYADGDATVPALVNGKPEMLPMTDGKCVDVGFTHITISRKAKMSDGSIHEQLLSFPLAGTSISVAREVERPSMLVRP
jgi:hypothetical protein